MRVLSSRTEPRHLRGRDTPRSADVPPSSLLLSLLRLRLRPGRRCLPLLPPLLLLTVPFLQLLRLLLVPLFGLLFSRFVRILLRYLLMVSLLPLLQFLPFLVLLLLQFLLLLLIFLVRLRIPRVGGGGTLHRW